MPRFGLRGGMPEGRGPFDKLRTGLDGTNGLTSAFFSGFS
jgi:hypothetical protein